MNNTDREAWFRLLKLSHGNWVEGSLSLRRQSAIRAAHLLILRYERELTRIRDHPEYAHEFAKDALELFGGLHVPLPPDPRLAALLAALGRPLPDVAKDENAATPADTNCK